MSRVLTSGYNEVFSVLERVVHRVVRAQFDSGMFLDWIRVQSTSPNNSSDIKVLLNGVGVEAGSSQADRAATVIIGIAQVQINPPLWANSGLISGTLRAAVNFVSQNNRLVADLANIRAQDVDISAVSGIPAASRGLAQSVIALALQNPNGLQFGTPFGLPSGLLSNAMDLRIREDPGPQDRDTFDAGLFENSTLSTGVAGSPSETNTTRGLAASLRSVLEPDKSFTLAISEASFQAIIQDAISERWLRETVKVPPRVLTTNEFEIEAPNDSGRARVSNLASSADSRLSGMVQNKTRNHSVAFSADSNGRFSIEIAAMPSDTIIIKFTAPHSRIGNDISQIVPGETLSKQGVKVTLPDASGLATVRCEAVPSGDQPRHSNVTGSITNVTQGGTVTFKSTTDDSFLVRIPARSGDELRIHGVSFRERSGGYDVDVFPPRMKLQGGNIRCTSTAIVRDVSFANLDIEAEITAFIFLEVDPVTGDIVPRVRTEVDAHLPILASLLVFLASPAGFVALQFLVAGMEDRSARSVSRSIREAFDRDFPVTSTGVVPSNLAAVFLEDIRVQPDGVIISGQIEAGVINRAGRVRTTMTPFVGHYVVIDSSSDITGFIVSELEVRTSSNGDAQIEELGLVEFEAIDDRTLASINYRTSRRPRPPVGSLVGQVFAIKTPSGRYSKIRIDRDDSEGMIVRFVTYEAPLQPTIEMNGSWTPEYDSANPETPMTVRTPSAYLGRFESIIDFRRLTWSDLNVTWSWEGPGTLSQSNTPWRYPCSLSIHAANLNLVEPSPWRNQPTPIDLDTPIFSDVTSPSTGAFSGILRVTATDIFGRQAVATRRLGGKIGYVLQIPQNIFRFEGPYPERPGRPGFPLIRP